MGHSKLEDELKPLRSTGESPELQGTGHIASPNLSINTITTKGAFKFLPKQTDLRRVWSQVSEELGLESQLCHLPVLFGFPTSK